LAANTASRDVDPVARAAARAASLAAASAYMHLDVPSTHQIKHALGPAVYVALAREFAADRDLDESAEPRTFFIPTESTRNWAVVSFPR
jgi:hypothetical protein